MLAPIGPTQTILFMKLTSDLQQGVRRTTESSFPGPEKNILAVAINGLCVIWPTRKPATCQFLIDIIAREAKYVA
jgi:hypothetical protein